MNSKKLLLYLSVFTIQGLCNSVIPILPELAVSGGSGGGPIASSLLYSGYFMGALLTMIPFGVLADRVGNLRLVGLGIFLTVLSGSIISVSENLQVLGTFRFVEGVGCGAFFPAAYSMLSEEKNSQKSLGEFTFLLNAGLAAGVYFSGLLAGYEIRTAIRGFTLLAWLAALGFLIYGGKTPTGKIESIESQTSENPAGLSPALYLKKIAGALFDNRFGKIWGTSILLYGTTGVVTAIYPLYSIDFLTKPELGLAISASYLAAMLGALAASRPVVKYRTIIRAGIIFAAAGILISPENPTLAFTLIGIGGGGTAVGLVTAVSEINSSGFAMGLFNTGVYVGLGLVPVLGSSLLGVLGFEKLFQGCALVLLAALLIKL
ncbi:MAG: MFS transporter [Methanosarcinaceae archaeon]|nr:MFS transporter [Methanosarcinaceae archaeon]